MLAPPGYAKIVSTPSRSRHATRISLPDIAGPRSALWAAGFFAISVVLLISFLAVCGWPLWFRRAGYRGCTKKPTTAFASRGFLSKTDLISTSPSGGVAYDDNQQDSLSNY